MSLLGRARLLFLLIPFGVASEPLWAEDRSPISLSALGALGFPSSPSNFSSTYRTGHAFGARFQRDLSPHWALGAQWMHMEFQSKLNTSDALDLQPITLLAEWRLYQGRRWAPYLNMDLGFSRNRKKYLSTQRIRTGLALGAGLGVQWDFMDLGALSLEGRYQQVDKATLLDEALHTTQATFLLTFYLPESWVPLTPKTELTLDDLEPSSDSPVGRMDETLLTQGEINRVLEQMEAGEMPPILFEAGLPTLLTTSYEALDNMGAVLRRHPTMKVRVYGFAEEDFVGGPVRANALALARSEAVRQYLIQNFRLADTNLVSAGIPPLPPVLEGQAPPTPPRRISFEVVP